LSNTPKKGRENGRREELLPRKAASSGGKPHKGGGDFSTREKEELSLSLKKERSLSSRLKISLLERSSSLEFPFDPFAVSIQ
jgi:hypothetical protein